MIEFLQHAWIRYPAEVISFCSILHNILPPWDWKPKFVEEGLCDFPWCQKTFYGILHNRYYKLVIYIVGYVAINMRSTLWKSISVSNPASQNVQNIQEKGKI